ncbi:hypothetical protein [Microbaculum marinum]|uniref:Chemotaxis methyl-accepting receptor HlyB-like 4HB MCP domain-containing protein n=1 Tax=Microbaculum marinum TaxID=1764581 RepID=A0AAW9RLE2_9HYPH
MSKDRSEFIHSIGEKLVIGILFATFSFLIFEQVKNSISERASIRDKALETANIISNYYLDIARDTILSLQDVRIRADEFNIIGDTDADDRRIKGGEIADLSRMILLKIEQLQTLEMDLLENSEPNNSSSGDKLKQYESKYREIKNNLASISNSATTSIQIEQDELDSLYESIAFLVSNVNNNVKSIIYSEADYKMTDGRFWEVSGFRYIIFAISLCLFGVLIVFILLPKSPS